MPKRHHSSTKRKRSPIKEMKCPGSNGRNKSTTDSRICPDTSMAHQESSPLRKRRKLDIGSKSEAESPNQRFTRNSAPSMCADNVLNKTTSPSVKTFVKGMNPDIEFMSNQTTSSLIINHEESQSGNATPASSQLDKCVDYLNSSGTRGYGRLRLSSKLNQRLIVTNSPVTIKHGDAQSGVPTPPSSQVIKAVNSSGKRGLGRPRLSSPKPQIISKSSSKLQELMTSFTPSRTALKSTTPLANDALQFRNRTRSNSKFTESNSSPSVVSTPSVERECVRTPNNARKSLDFEDKNPVNSLPITPAQEPAAGNSVSKIIECKGNIAPRDSNQIDVTNVSTEKNVQPETTQSPNCDTFGVADERKTDAVRLRTRSRSGRNNSREVVTENAAGLSVRKCPVTLGEAEKNHMDCVSFTTGALNGTEAVEKIQKDVHTNSKETIQHEAVGTKSVMKCIANQDNGMSTIRKTPTKTLLTIPGSKDAVRVTRHSVLLSTPAKIKHVHTDECVSGTKSQAKKTTVLSQKEQPQIKNNTDCEGRQTDLKLKSSKHNDVRTTGIKVGRCREMPTNRKKEVTEIKTNIQQQQQKKATRTSPRNSIESSKSCRKSSMVSHCQGGTKRSNTISPKIPTVSLVEKHSNGTLRQTQYPISVNQCTDTISSHETSCENKSLTRSDSTSAKEIERERKTTAPEFKYCEISTVDLTAMEVKMIQVKPGREKTIFSETSTQNSQSVESRTAKSPCKGKTTMTKKQNKLMPGQLVKLNYKPSSNLVSLVSTPKTAMLSTRSSVTVSSPRSLGESSGEHENQASEIRGTEILAAQSNEINSNEYIKKTELESGILSCKTNQNRQNNYSINTAVSCDNNLNNPIASDVLSDEIRKQLNAKSKPPETHSGETNEKRSFNDSRNDKDIMVTTEKDTRRTRGHTSAAENPHEERTTNPNTLNIPVKNIKPKLVHSIEEQRPNLWNGTGKKITCEIQSDELTNKSCDREIDKLFENADTMFVGKAINNDNDENNRVSYTAWGTQLHQRTENQHGTHTSCVLPNVEDASNVASKQNTVPVEAKCLENDTEDIPQFGRLSNSDNTTTVQAKEFKRTAPDNEDKNNVRHQGEPASHDVNSNTILNIPKRSLKGPEIMKPMSCRTLTEHAAPTGTNRTQDIEQKIPGVAVIQKAEQVVIEKACTSPQPVKGESFTPKRSSRLQARSNGSTPKRFDDFFVPTKRKKSSPKTERNSLNKSVTEEDEYSPLKYKDEVLKVKGKTLSDSAHIREASGVEKSEIKNLPKKTIVSYSKTEKGHISVVETDNQSDKKDKETPNRNFVERKLTMKRETSTNERQKHNTVCNERNSEINDLGRHLPSEFRETKKDRLHLNKFKIMNSTKVKLKGNWNDPLIPETGDKDMGKNHCVNSNTNTTKHTIDNRKESKLKVSAISSINVHSPLKMRIHRTSQSLAIESLQLSNNVDEDSGPSVSQAPNKRHFKSKGNAARQKKLKKLKSGPRTIIKVEDLMRNEELSDHAFTLWKSEKGWDVQRLHLGKLGQLETHLKEAWRSLSQDDHKKYFLRVLGALTDENKHSPGRLLIDDPAVKSESTSGLNSGRTKAQEVEIQTAIDRKLTAFRQMSIAKQHNLLKQNFTCVQRMLSKEKYARFSLSVKQALRCLRSKKESTPTDNEELEQESRDLMFLQVLKERDSRRQENERAKAEAAVAVKQQFEQFVARLIVGDSVPFDSAVRCQELRQALVDLQDLEKKSRVSVSGDVTKSKSFESLVQDIQTTAGKFCGGGLTVELSGGGGGDYLTTCNVDEMSFLQELPPIVADSSFVEKLLEENAQCDLQPLDSEFLEDVLHDSRSDMQQVSDEVVVNSVLDDAVSAIEALTHGLPCCDLNSPSCVLSALLVLEKLTGSKSQ